MTIEGESEEPRPIRVIRFYPQQRSFIIDVTDGPVFALALSRMGIFYQPFERSVVVDEPEQPTVP
jgi:hypothetical protein